MGLFNIVNETFGDIPRITQMFPTPVQAGNFCNDHWLKNAMMPIPDDRPISTDVLTQHQHWTEGRTDGRKCHITIACQILTRVKKQQNTNETRR